MRFHGPLETAFQATRNAALTRSDTGVAALSCCLWLTQLLANAPHGRTTVKAGLLLAVNFVPLFEGANWVVCRSRVRCLTLLKMLLFMLLCWNAGGDDGAAASHCPAAASCGASLHAGAVSMPAWGAFLAEQCPAGCAPCAPAAASPRSSASLVVLFAESKLYALLHSGLAFRYTRWQHTAAMQAVLVAVAAALTSPSGPCIHPERQLLQTGWTTQQAASLLTSSGLPAYAAAAAAANSASGGGGGEGGALPLLFNVPEGVDTCRLVLAWAQVCLGLVVPLWAAVLGEEYARARFAAAHVAHLLPSEKEWAVTTATGAEWLAAAFHIPLACLAAWYLLLAGAAAACSRGLLCLGAGGG